MHDRLFEAAPGITPLGLLSQRIRWGHKGAEQIDFKMAPYASTSKASPVSTQFTTPSPSATGT